MLFSHKGIEAKLSKRNKPIKQMAETLGMGKSTIWHILKKKECTCELSNIKRPGRPQTTTKVDECRILSLAKKNPKDLTQSRTLSRRYAYYYQSLQS